MHKKIHTLEGWLAHCERLHPHNIDMAEDRYKFSKMLDSIGVDQPEWKELKTMDEATAFANKVGYPVLVRPSYVLSGAAMKVAFRQRAASLGIGPVGFAPTSLPASAGALSDAQITPRVSPELTAALTAQLDFFVASALLERVTGAELWSDDQHDGNTP